MKFSMTGLEKDDYLIEVAALSGLTVYIYIYIVHTVIFPFPRSQFQYFQQLYGPVHS